MTTPAVLSAGVVELREPPEGWRVLLLRVYNYWDFPKGRVEPVDLPLATAKRETREETTLEDLDFARGDVHFDTAPYGREKKVARYFVSWATTEKLFLPVNPELGKSEHHEWRWCNWQAAEQLVPEKFWPVLRWAEDQL